MLTVLSFIHLQSSLLPSQLASLRGHDELEKLLQKREKKIQKYLDSQQQQQQTTTTPDSPPHIFISPNVLDISANETPDISKLSVQQ